MGELFVSGESLWPLSILSYSELEIYMTSFSPDIFILVSGEEPEHEHCVIMVRHAHFGWMES